MAQTDLDPAVILLPLARGDVDWLFVKGLLRTSCPSAKLVELQRVQWPVLWDEFVGLRDRHLGEEANEQLLFHGTGACSAKELFAHPFGLDPRYSSGGFYGNGIYLADEVSYPVGGRYAHRVAGSGGTRLQLLLVRANLGVQQELGQRIDQTTKAMKMPGKRSEGGLFHSVRAAPHRPFLSGTGESSLDASVVHVVFEYRLLYPQYVLEIEFDLAPELASTLASAAAEAPPGTAGSSAASGSGAGSSSSSSCPAPAGPPAKRARRSGPSGASVPAAAAAAVPIAPGGELETLVAALVREGPADKTQVVVALRVLLQRRDEASNAWVAAAGGIEALVALVRDGSMDGKAAAAGALCILAYHHEGRSASIAAAGGIEALVALVRDGSPFGKSVAAAALFHLGINHAERKASIKEAGGIEALEALLRDGMPLGKEPAAKVLSMLNTA